MIRPARALARRLMLLILALGLAAVPGWAAAGRPAQGVHPVAAPPGHVLGPVLGAPYLPVRITAAGDLAPADGVPPPTSRGAASLPGLRIRTGERGLYRLTYAAMLAAGAPAETLDPSRISLWYLGRPVDIRVTGSEDGRFDPGDEVRFYAEPYAGRYMTQNVYRLTWSGDAGARMGSLPAVPWHASSPVTTMLGRARVENDRVYYSTYRDLARDADHFFDNPLYPLTGYPTATVTYTLDLLNLVPLGNAELRVGVHGGLSLLQRSPDQSLALRLNGALLGPYQWDGSVAHIITQTVPASGLTSGPNRLALVAGLSQLPGLDKYWVSPDWAEIAYPARTVAKDDRLFIEQAIDPAAPPGAADIAASGFAASGVGAYDVTDPRHPLQLVGAEESWSAGDYSLLFAERPGASYYLAAPSGLLEPAALEFDAGSSLGTPENSADYIAIVHRSLWDAIQPLLDHRAAEGLRVAKVDVQDIYDEFSGGRVDPEAVRSFLSYAWRNWNAGGRPPQYVLLAGDGHFDFKGALRPGLPNLIPPYLVDVDPFIGETAADNRYVSVDGDADFLPEMAVGRIPAKTPADVTAVVNKILSYETSEGGAWQKRTVFIADDSADPAGDFHALSDQSLAALPQGYAAQTIYYNSGPGLDTPSEMKAAVNGAFGTGAIYLQWFGHASRTFWGQDRFWDLNDPAKLSQSTALPFTAAYSCWAGYFINVLGSAQYGNNEQSLAETMLLAPGRSSLADLSPSGLHVGNDLVILSQALVNALFTERIDRVGLAVNAAKLSYFAGGGSAPDLIDTQVLFGDPATRLKLPPEQIYLPLLRK